MNGHGAHGEPRVVALSDVLGTAGIYYELRGDYRYRIVGLCFQVACAGGGGARQVIAELRDSTGATVFGVAAPGTQASGETVVYSFAPELTANGSSALGFQQAPFIGGELPENLTLVVFVVGAGGTDTITNARLLVEQRRREPEPE